jgi:hypothetical protein
MDAERIAFDIVPSVLGLFLVLYSVTHIRRVRADFFTVIRGWIFALFLASLVLLWLLEASEDYLGAWPEETHVAGDITFMVIAIWLSVCLVALNTRYRTFSTLDHFFGWMKTHPANLLTIWGAVGLFVIVYSWAENPAGADLADDPAVLALAVGYLAASIAVNLLLPLVRRDTGLAPKEAHELFGGMRGMVLAWIAMPATELVFDVVLRDMVEYDGPNPYSWIMVGLFAAILGTVIDTRFTALIVDPEVESAKRSGFRAYDIPRGPYLIENERPDSAAKLFSELVSLPLRPDADLPAVGESASATLEFLIPRGLIITREYPENIRQAYSIQVTPIIWLTEMPGERRIAPTSLAVLTDTVIRFMESNPNSIVLLEGVEYLITFNEFKKVLRYLDSLNETTWMTKGRLLIATNPKAYDEKELALLERDRRVVRGDEGIEQLRKASKVASGGAPPAAPNPPRAQ